MSGPELTGYVLLGGIAGLLAGLLGIGGGLVMVPGLLWLFVLGGVESTALTQLAVGTSLAVIVFTAAVSTAAHHRHRAVQWPVVARLAPGLVLGAVLGAALADRLDSLALRRVFALFELLVALQLLLDLRPSPARALPAGPALAGAGGLIGLVSALVGIGGGTLTTPFLLWYRLGLRRAIATSAACGLPIALAGAASYGVGGGRDAGVAQWSCLLAGSAGPGAGEHGRGTPGGAPHPHPPPALAAAGLRSAAGPGGAALAGGIARA